MDDYKNVYTNNDQNSEFNTPAEPPKSEAIKTMVFGILSIYLGWFTPFSIVGWIFAVLARKWSLPIIADYPCTSAYKFAKIGRVTGTVGLWLSIVATVLWALLIIFYILYIVFLFVVMGVSAGMDIV